MIRRIDRYELIEEVGTGGMSVVYRGRDTALDREVAIKVLHPHLASRSEARARFSREARAVARLSHPNILEIFDYSGDGAQEAWLVTEFIHGRTLREAAGPGGLPWPEIAALVCRALADALAHAHAAGVIHRDLKPENVMVSEVPGSRAVKLADFGIARVLAYDDRMTMTGALMGSPNHMAPEIVEGKEADAQSDVFSLGTILYWGCTGKLPFDAPNPTATLRLLVEGRFVDPRQASPAVTEPLARLVRKALAHDPAMRPAGAGAFRDALDVILRADGLDRPADELQAYLDAPDAYAAALPARLVAARLARGDALRERGDVAGALDAYDAVLAVDPRNSTVERRLSELQRRTRLRRMAVGAGVAAAVIVTALLGWKAWRGSVPSGPVAPVVVVAPAPSSGEPPASAPAAPTAPSAQEAPAVQPAVATAPAPPARSSPRTAAAALPAPGRAATGATVGPGAPVPLVVHVRPYAARALLDGTEVARGEQRVVFAIGPGTHRLRVEHPCCTPYERSVDPATARSLGELKVPLEPRPALLRVSGPAATSVYLAGRLLGTAEDSQRDPFRVPVPADPANPYEGQVEVTLAVPGRSPAVVPLKVRAGQEITVPVMGAEGGSP